MDRADRTDRSDQTDRPGDWALTLARAYREITSSRSWPLVEADLVAQFGANPFRPGRSDETAYYCGCQAVLERFLQQSRLADQNVEPLPETSQT